MYHKAFALDADFMPTYRNYARLKIKMGDLQAAFAYLEKAIQKGLRRLSRHANRRQFRPAVGAERTVGGADEKIFSGLNFGLINLV
jgi:hypothetical protein